MVKSKLVQKLCNMHPNILRKDMERIVEVIISEIIGALCRNEAVELRGFGRFKSVTRKARTGKNPKNSETLQIPEKKVMRWKMSKNLYNRLNKNAEKKAIPFCLEHNLGIIGRVPLARGHLSGKYEPNHKFPENDKRYFEGKNQTITQLKMVQDIKKNEVPDGIEMAQWSLAWCLKNPAITTVIPGCKNIEQIESNVKATELI